MTQNFRCVTKRKWLLTARRNKLRTINIGKLKISLISFMQKWLQFWTSLSLCLLTFNDTNMFLTSLIWFKSNVLWVSFLSSQLTTFLNKAPHLITNNWNWTRYLSFQFQPENKNLFIRISYLQFSHWNFNLHTHTLKLNRIDIGNCGCHV